MLTYKNIVVGIDFTELGEIALAAAADFADRHGADRLHLVHVVPNPPSWAFLAPPVSAEPFGLAWDRAFKLQEQKLRESKVRANGTKITHETRLGNAARELVRAGAEVHADLIVLAGHRRSSVSRAVLGSVAMTVLRAAHCPVWVVGEDRRGATAMQRVLAAIDTSPTGERVLAHAMALATPDRGVVHVFSVHEVRTVIDTLEGSWPKGMNISDLLEALDQRYRTQVGTLVERVRVPRVAVEVDVVSGGSPSRAILAISESTKPDLIVLGTSGHSAWKRMFLGSTATRVVNEAPCPVFVVPAEGE